jgi:hypothetical protein
MLTRQQIAFLHPEYLALPARPDVQRDLRADDRCNRSHCLCVDAR